MPSEAAVTTRPVFTDVDVCNLALTQLGENHITSVQSPQSEIAQFCHDVYEPVVCSELSKFEWSFAKAFKALSPKAGATLLDWTYVYELPNDCLVVRRTSVEYDRWEVYGTQVGYNATPLNLFYTRRAPEKDWPGYFLDAMAMILASRLAVAIQHDRGVGADFAVLGAQAMADARVRDYQANPPQSIRGDANVAAIRAGYHTRPERRYR